MQKTSYILGVFILCLSYQVTAQTQQPPLISVTGQGQVKVQPNEAVVSIGVQTHAVSVVNLPKESDTQAANIISYLEEQGIAAKDIQTSYLSLQPFYNNSDSDSGETPEYYIAQKSMTFLLRNLSNYDNVMSGLYELGVNSVDGITFQSSNTTGQQAKARSLAAANAIEIATALTDELGATLGKVYSISESDGRFARPFAFRENLAESSGSSGPSIAGGEIVISSSVSVSFYID